MLEELILSQHNLQIFNYSYIFKHLIEKNLINDLYEFKLLANKRDSTIRRLFIHHNIHSICNYILKSKKKGKQIVYFDFNNLLDGELLSYIEEDKVKCYLEYVIHKIKNILPIRVYYSTFSLEYLKSKIDKNTGLAKETVARIKNVIETHNYDKFTFEKCKKFVKKQGLTFLDKTYFNGLKAKQLLIN